MAFILHHFKVVTNFRGLIGSSLTPSKECKQCVAARREINHA